MARIRASILLACITGASAVITASIYHPEQHGRATASHFMPLWERWQVLGESERRALIEDHQSVFRRADVAEVFRRARVFASSPAEQQELLRSLHEVLDEALAKLPAARRTLLLSLHPHARAEALYHFLETDSPETIDELRGRLRERS